MNIGESTNDGKLNGCVNSGAFKIGGVTIGCSEAIGEVNKGDWKIGGSAKGVFIKLGVLKIDGVCIDGDFVTDGLVDDTEVTGT